MRKDRVVKERILKRAVRDGYAQIAKRASSCCGDVSSVGVPIPEEISKKAGYTEEDLLAAPPESNLGLGCGNPVALANIRPGEKVLDLGCGAGFDCFLAAGRVGVQGQVIGVDMTSEMVERARANARKGGYKNIDFRQGELENLPVADSYVDLVISNCVINLVPDKERVFKEAFRVLKPGGALTVSDIVLVNKLPEFIASSTGAYIGCLAGAIMKDDYLHAIRSVGFKDVEVLGEAEFPVECLLQDSSGESLLDKELMPGSEELKEASASVRSLRVRAVKSL